MKENNIMLDLSNHFLIAMPDLEDSLFSGSLIYLCEHSKDGAMGLIINKPWYGNCLYWCRHETDSSTFHE